MFSLFSSNNCDKQELSTLSEVRLDKVFVVNKKKQKKQLTLFGLFRIRREKPTGSARTQIATRIASRIPTGTCRRCQSTHSLNMKRLDSIVTCCSSSPSTPNPPPTGSHRNPKREAREGPARLTVSYQAGSHDL